MSIDRPPKSLVWKDRLKSRKVSKIRTVSTIHRTTRLEPPAEDTSSDTAGAVAEEPAPQPNVGNAAGAVEEEQAPPEPMIQAQTVQPPVPPRKKAKMVWPRGSGAPGFGRYRGTKWYDFETEEQDKHDDPPLPATTSNTRRSFPVPKYEDRHSESESGSKDDKSPGGDREQPGTGKMSPESEYHFDFRPDTSSESSNPAEREPIPNERNEGYPQFCIDEFEDTEDYLNDTFDTASQLAGRSSKNPTPTTSYTTPNSQG
jgi:hypothetical protein